MSDENVKEKEESKAEKGNEKVAELTNLLDSYFDEESLRQKYEKEVPINRLKEIAMVAELNVDNDTLVKAVEACKKLSLDGSKTLVKSNQVTGRTTLIIRDLPADVSFDDIKKLLENPVLNEQLAGRYKELLPELNQCWMVRFATQEDCLNAALWLNINGKINGEKVKCRVKSVLSQNKFSATNAYNAQTSGGVGGMEEGAYPYPQGPYNNYNYMPYQQFPYHQQFNNWGGAAVPPYPQRGRGRRRSRGRGRGRGRNRNYPGSPRGRRGRRDSRRNSKQNDSGGIFYEAEFKFYEKATFEQCVKEAMNENGNEPVCPEAYTGHEDIKAAVPKKQFNLSKMIPISPMPEPESTGNSVPKMSLNDKDETKEEEDQKEKEEPKAKKKNTAKADPTKADPTKVES